MSTHLFLCILCYSSIQLTKNSLQKKNCIFSEKSFKRKIYHHLYFISGSIHFSKMGVVLRNKIKMNISKWIDAIVLKLTACDSMLGLCQHFFLRGIVNQSINHRWENTTQHINLFTKLLFNFFSTTTKKTFIVINDLKLLASLSSRDAIIQPIFTLKKCLIHPQQTAKNMYIRHFLFLKGFLYTNILFKIPTC